ncbi:lipid A-modifier LpxR family protein [Primorskyibacter sp. S187A]|uniref:lipid A-modifier LpxR family protein n=1 Tax=Primorskyibacter sp. S187A TaxID=3415130 RepID=UPI003C7ACA20
MLRLASSAVAIGLTLSLLTPSAQAEGRERIGYGRLISNDLIGDGRDRWQTGSYSSSYVNSSESWTGRLPTRPGVMLEYRIDAAVMSPNNLRWPDADDRPAAGHLRLALGTQFALGQLETDLQASLSFVGPENGLIDLQTGLHDLLPGATTPSKSVRDGQVDLDPTLGARAEIGRTLSYGHAHLRPFLAAETGVETLARAGFDLTIGTFGMGGAQARDMITGHRYRVVEGEGRGLSFVLGGDMAHVADSQLLSDDDDMEFESTRNRLRAGVHWQTEGRNLFYGLTYLSPEFEAQDEGQTTGSVRIDWQF